MNEGDDMTTESKLEVTRALIPRSLVMSRWHMEEMGMRRGGGFRK